MKQEEKDKMVDDQPENEMTDSSSESQETKEQPVISEADALKNEVSELKDKYLRLYSEFENFRKRTIKEKTDLSRTASEDVIKAVIPVLDDFERARKSFEESDETKSIREGVDLIYNKLYKTLEGKGLKPMTSLHEAFNPELHEAITQIPAPSEDLKGKVVDEIEKGYFLNEKVVRFAKVVTGA